MSVFEVGDRVYYRDNGPDDRGEVVRVDLDGYWVVFDGEVDADPYDASQLVAVEES